MSYDSSTGELFGSMSINKYYMTGMTTAISRRRYRLSQGTPIFSAPSQTAKL